MLLQVAPPVTIAEDPFLHASFLALARVNIPSKAPYGYFKAEHADKSGTTCRRSSIARSDCQVLTSARENDWLDTAGVAKASSDRT